MYIYNGNDITAAVLIKGGEILLMTEPDRMPHNIAPYKIVGYFRLRADGETVFDTPDKNTAILMGLALPAFAAHVAKVQSGAVSQPGDSVAWLERLHSLDSGEGR